MRHQFPHSLSALCLLLLALVVIPSALIAEAARSAPEAPPREASAGEALRPSSGPAAGTLPEAEAARVRESYGRLPLSFEANRGQANARVRFLARNSAYSLFLTEEEITLALRGAGSPDAARGQANRAASGASVLRIKLLGANRRASARGLEELEGRSNYLVGRDPSRWRTGVPNYGRVKFEGVYPGVDVVYYGTNRQLEYDFALAAGADAGRIRLRVEGAEGMRIDANGDLVLPTAAGDVRQHAPQAYQEVEGVRRTVSCRYVLRGAGQVGFELGEYDRGLPLVIDPILAYSTYLGGSGFDEGNAVAVDAQGNAYVVGKATSFNFPTTPGAFQIANASNHAAYASYDAFVTKLNASGTGLVYSTYLGGAGNDQGTSITVDAAGQAHVAGHTQSDNFPVYTGAYRRSRAGWQDVFVTKLNAAGSGLLYSTYLGGSGFEENPRLALSASGDVYVGGRTSSVDFPVTPGAFQPQARVGAWSTVEGFVTRLSPEPGRGLIFSTYLGGSGDDFVGGIAPGPAFDESVYVTGRTASADFPTTPGAFQTAYAGDGWTTDAFVTRLDAGGAALVYSTYFGGAADDQGVAVAADASGAAYVAGLTSSPSLATTPGAFQTTYAGGGEGNNYDAFVAKFGPSGSDLIYSTYLGGNGGDSVNAVALDAQGSVYVAGETGSTNFPVSPDAWQTTYGGGYFDAFVVKLNETGTALAYGTYLGGFDWEQARGVALGEAGDVYLAGNTQSYDFPTTAGAAQRSFRGGADAFVAKLSLGVEDFSVSGRVTNEHGNGLRGVEVTVGGDLSKTAFTDGDGYYRVNGLPPAATVTVTASRFGFVFDPPEGVTLAALSQDETINFSGAAPLVITGRVTDAVTGYGAYVPVTLYSDAGAYTEYTGYDGTYSFNVAAGGNYTVTPGPDPEYTFTPPERSVTNLTGDVVWDFSAKRTPRLMGRVSNEYNYAMSNIRVTLTGPSLGQPVVETTDVDGFFVFNGLEFGATYTVTPSDPSSNRTFAPPSRTVTVTQPWEAVDFQLLPPLAIHGRVSAANNTAVPCVVTLSGTTNAEAQVDQWGYFTFFDLPRGGDYTVTVTKPGSLYTFAPPSRAVTDLQQMQYMEFEALPPLRILGQVADSNYIGLSAATVTLSGAVNATTQADQYGFYSFEELPRGGDYTVTPSHPLYTFAPPSRSVSDIQTDQFAPFEALPPLRIMGGVADGNGLGVAGITVTLSGAVNATTQTDEGGTYRFIDLPRGGNYTVTPAHELYNFAPPSREFVAMKADEFAGFDAALRRFTLSGRAADSGGAPLAGVTLTLEGGEPGVTQTDANGNYAFTNLRVGRGYTITAARPGYAFAPETLSLPDPRGDQTANFNGSRLVYTLGGRVTDSATGAGLSGVSVNLGGSLAATAQTDAAGNYSFTGLPSEGNYTVAASHPNFDLAPPSRAFNNLLGDASADFSATRINYSLSGRVADSSGGALSGVTVTLGGARSAATQTDASGRYLFADLPSGFGYTLTAARTHYAFGPPTRQVEDLGGDTTADFTATLLAHNISGRVVDSNGNGFAGAVVALAGARTGSATTDANGNYSFAALPAGGNYTVEPSRQFYDFSPSRGSFNDLGADATANFTATLRTFNVGGRVAEGANGVAGLTVNLGGSRVASTQTDAAGNYLFTGLPADGSYTVTPAANPVYGFAPGGAAFNTLPFNQTANFAATRLLYGVSGYTLDACGRAVQGVTMSLTRDGLTASAQTNSAGFYSFAGVQAGYNYTLAPTGSAYTFSPPSLLFPGLSANQAGNFTGRPPTATANAFALADLYVRGGVNAGTNYGKTTQLITRLSGQAKDTYETYLRFDVGQPCTVAAVKLRLYGQLSGSGTLPVSLYAVPSTTWTETGTNWNNRPAAGALLRAVNVTGTAGAWYEWDVTDYVRAELAAGRGVVSFALKTHSATSYQAAFTSREAAGTNAPRLAVTTP